MKEEVAQALMEEWCTVRDDWQYKECAAACVRFAYTLQLITLTEHDVWQAGLNTCPGHDDEGGRSWCAYCGNISPYEDRSEEKSWL